METSASYEARSAPSSYSTAPDRAKAVEMFVRDDTLMGRIVEVRPTGPRFVEVRRAPGRH